MKRVGNFLGMVVTVAQVCKLRVVAVMSMERGRSGDNEESCPLGLVSKGLAAWGAREGESSGRQSRGACPDSSVLWAEVSELCRPMSFARNLLPGAMLPSSPCLG